MGCIEKNTLISSANRASGLSLEKCAWWKPKYHGLQAGLQCSKTSTRSMLYVQYICILYRTHLYQISLPFILILFLMSEQWSCLAATSIYDRWVKNSSSKECKLDVELPHLELSACTSLRIMLFGVLKCFHEYLLSSTQHLNIFIPIRWSCKAILRRFQFAATCSTFTQAICLEFACARFLNTSSQICYYLCLAPPPPHPTPLRCCLRKSAIIAV